jgi:hypothetical protein
MHALRIIIYFAVAFAYGCLIDRESDLIGQVRGRITKPALQINLSNCSSLSRIVSCDYSNRGTFRLIDPHNDVLTLALKLGMNLGKAREYWKYAGWKKISKAFTKHACQHVIESRDESTTLQIQDFLGHSGIPMLF